MRGRVYLVTGDGWWFADTSDAHDADRIYDLFGGNLLMTPFAAVVAGEEVRAKLQAKHAHDDVIIPGLAGRLKA